MQSVLLLNANATPISLSPLSTIGWQMAIKAYFLDKVKIVKNYEDKIIHSANFDMPMPSVVMLKRFHKIPESPKFSRRNMYIRDKYICQYCDTLFHPGELTIDHVLPRWLGGMTTWTNCTTACKKCNVSKGKELIKPIRIPHKTRYFEIHNNSKIYTLTSPDAEWQNYLQWPEDLLKIAA